MSAMNGIELLQPRMSRRRLLLGMAGASLVLGVSGLVRAAGAKTLTVTYYDDFAPYSFVTADGQAAGIYIDCLDALLGHRHGIRLTHLAMPWARAQQEVKEGRADAFVTSPSDARNAYVAFNREPILQQDRVVVFSREHPKADRIRQVTDREDLKQFVIGTYYGDARINTLFEGMNLDLAPDIKQTYMKIASGRVDLTVTDTSIWKYQTRTLDIRKVLDSVLLSKAPPTHLGIRNGYPERDDLLALFDQALIDAKADGTLAQIIARYTEAE